MPNTITAFTTFVASTKAKAEQVNVNFSNFRGTFLPINETTITASNLAHDLGSTEHKWRDIYAESMVLDATASVADLLISNSIRGPQKSLTYSTGATVTSINTAGVSSITGFSLSITTYGGPLMIGLTPLSDENTNSSINLDSNTNTVKQVEGTFYIYKDDSITNYHSEWTVVSPTLSAQGGFPLSSFSHVIELTAGSYTFDMRGESSALIQVFRARLFAYEL